jgi:DNA-directed RNA polymerase specialized sigma24 family protein
MTNEERLKLFISRHQQRVFALVMYLIGGDRDKTYDICAASFAEAMYGGSFSEPEEAVLTRMIGAAVEKSRVTKAIPTANEIESLDLSDAEKGPLHLVLKALHALDFDAKALVLLRDQLNLSYRQIAAIVRNSESQTRSQVIQARIRLREIIEDTLRNE